MTMNIGNVDNNDNNSNNNNNSDKNMNGLTVSGPPDAGRPPGSPASARGEEAVCK